MISVVIPIHNEEQNLPILAGKLTAALGTIGREYEVLFINDGSTDGTADRIHEVCRSDLRFKAIHFRRNSGQTAAMQAEVDPESWTGRIVNAKSGKRSPCPKNDVSTVPSSKPRLVLMP